MDAVEQETFKLNFPSLLNEVWELVVEDSKLPENIRPDNPGSEKKPSEIKDILITGATGHLGCHMIKELLENCPQLQKIYCLVRGDDPGAKLKTVFEGRKLILPDNFAEKVITITGDISQKKLALSDQRYEALCNEVDAIVHLAAKVNYRQIYSKYEGRFPSVRTTNVTGLLNVLDLACKIKTKHVWNASTFACCIETSPEDGSLIEEWPILKICQLYTILGYPVSKYVCDLLLKTATETRGIPCKSFRYGELRESTSSEFCTTKDMLVMKSFLLYMKFGVVPKMAVHLQIIPVDIASKLTIKIIFNNEAPNNVYLVTHPKPGKATEGIVQAALEMGYSITPVELEDYRLLVCKCFEKTQSNLAGKLNASLFQQFFENKQLFKSMLNLCPKNGNENSYKSKRLTEFAFELYSKMEPVIEILKRDIVLAIKDGLLD